MQLNSQFRSLSLAFDTAKKNVDLKTHLHIFTCDNCDLDGVEELARAELPQTGKNPADGRSKLSAFLLNCINSGRLLRKLSWLDHCLAVNHF
jgi:hypothetical protein